MGQRVTIRCEHGAAIRIEYEPIEAEPSTGRSAGLHWWVVASYCVTRVDCAEKLDDERVREILSERELSREGIL